MPSDSSAMRVFVCNVATQHGETDGFTVTDHLEALERHAGTGIVHAMIANNNIAPELPESWHSAPVRLRQNGHAKQIPGIHVVEADVVAPENRYRHDPLKLAATIYRLYDERNILVPAATAAARETPALVTR